MIASILVLSSVLCIPGNALLRKFGILKMSYSKKVQADMHGVTSSTVAFSRAADDEEDSDSGHNSEELVTAPFLENKDTSCAIEEEDNVKL